MIFYLNFLFLICDLCLFSENFLNGNRMQSIPIFKELRFGNEIIIFFW